MKNAMALAVCTMLTFSNAAFAQTADPQLLAEINKIKAIDNHSHPPKLVGANEKDDDFDALPCDPLDPAGTPAQLRPENPQYLSAWKALYGYKYNDMSADHVRELLQAKQKIKVEQGDNYPAWVLDQLGIESELANRVAMGRGLTAPRFRWVPFEDALLFPLNNADLAAQNPDRKFFFSREDMLLQRYMKAATNVTFPGDLDDYTAKVITPILEMHKKNGAVAIKFEAAYLRSLDFEPAQKAQAAEIYSRYATSGSPPPQQEYRILQDYLFRYIAREAGRLGLPVHIHTGGGCGGYFYLRGSDPTLLESVFNDATLRQTTFVMLHGGSAGFEQKIGYLLMKPNVYADISEQTWMAPPRQLSIVLRRWLEWFPEKVLFGTDLFPGVPEIDWEEIGFQASSGVREALAIALTGMVNDGEMTRARALEIAHLVLHDNAAKLYGASK